MLLTASVHTIILQSCSPAYTTALLQKGMHQSPTNATSLIKASYSPKHITATIFLSLKFVLTLWWAKMTRLAMTICTMRPLRTSVDQTKEAENVQEARQGSVWDKATMDNKLIYYASPGKWLKLQYSFNI